MARVQVQSPETLGIVPQAQPVGQTRQARYVPPVPRDVLDLMQFSPALAGFVGQVREDEAKRQIALGEATVALARPLGDPVAYGPEMEANRKANEALVKSGELARSNNPHFRLGMLSGEARRAALQARDAIMRDDVILGLSRAYDERGNLVMNHEDIDSAFDRLIQPYLSIPALHQNIYAQRVAVDLFDGLRAEFHTKVANQRDAELQKYAETETTSQLSDMMSTLAAYKEDPSPEGQKLFQEAAKGLGSMRVSMTIKPGLLDPPQTFRNAARAFVLRQAELGKGAEAVDLARMFAIGSTTIGEDTSERGIKFREVLEQLEREYEYDVVRMKQRDDELHRLNRKAAMDAYETRISEEPWAQNPLAVRQRLDELASAQGGEYRDEFLQMNRDRYRLETQAVEPDARVSEEVQRRITRESGSETTAWLDMMAETGQIPYSQRNEEAGRVAAASQWVGSAEFVSEVKVFDDQSATLVDGKTTDARFALNTFRADVKAKALDAIRARMATLPPTDAAGRAAAISEEFAKAGKDVEAKALALRDAERNLETVRRERNAKGVSVRSLIQIASREGVITSEQAARFDAENERDTSTVPWLKNPLVEAAAALPFRGTPPDLIDAEDVVAVRARAQKWVRDFYQEHRGKSASLDEFEFAFTTAAQTELPKLLLEAAGVTDAKPGSEKMTSVAEKVATGASDRPEAEAARADQLAGQSMRKAIAAAQGNIETNTIRVVSEAQWASPKGVKSPALDQMARAYGRWPAQVIQARRAAREEFVGADTNRKLAGDPALVLAARQKLLSTGFATPEELQRGEIAGIQIQKQDVKPWTQPFFPDKATWDSWAAKSDGGAISALAAKYGVDVGNQSEFDAWKATQLVLIEGSRRQEPNPITTPGYYERLK